MTQGFPPLPSRTVTRPDGGQVTLSLAGPGMPAPALAAAQHLQCVTVILDDEHELPSVLMAPHRDGAMLPGGPLQADRGVVASALSGLHAEGLGCAHAEQAGLVADPSRPDTSLLVVMACLDAPVPGSCPLFWLPVDQLVMLTSRAHIAAVNRAIEILDLPCEAGASL